VEKLSGGNQQKVVIAKALLYCRALGFVIREELEV